MSTQEPAAESMATEGDRPGGLSYVPQFQVQAGGPGRTAWVLGLAGVALGLIVLVIATMH